MEKRKIFRLAVYLVLAAIIIGSISVWYVFNKPHRDIASEKALFNLTAQQLMTEYQTNENSANEKFLNQVIVVTGKIAGVKSLENSSFIVSLEDEMQGVTCSFDSSDVQKYKKMFTDFTPGSQATIKGRCSGMLMDVQLLNCVPKER